MIITFTLNGDEVHIDANPGERLLHILRKRFTLLSAKDGCLSGRCGSCMVLMDGKPVSSCLVPLFQVKDCAIVTLEAFIKTGDYVDIAEGFAKAGVDMCGFCNAGKILVAHAILEGGLRPQKDEIRRMYSGNICRCTGIDELVNGVRNAAEIRRRRQNGK